MSLALPDRKYPATRTAAGVLPAAAGAAARPTAQFRAVSVGQQHARCRAASADELAIDGRPLAAGEQPPMVTMLTVDPRYFETLGLPLHPRPRASTPPTARPGRRAPSSTRASRRCTSPNEDPIGRRIDAEHRSCRAAPPPTGGIPTSLTATIVGIAPNVRQRNFDAGRDRSGRLSALSHRSARVHDAARAQRRATRTR